jgi:hypothetical protein
MVDGRLGSWSERQGARSLQPRRASQRWRPRGGVVSPRCARRPLRRPQRAGWRRESDRSSRPCPCPQACSRRAGRPRPESRECRRAGAGRPRRRGAGPRCRRAGDSAAGPLRPRARHRLRRERRAPTPSGPGWAASRPLASTGGRWACTATSPSRSGAAARFSSQPVCACSAGTARPLPRPALGAAAVVVTAPQAIVDANHVVSRPQVAIRIQAGRCTVLGNVTTDPILLNGALLGLPWNTLNA